MDSALKQRLLGAAVLIALAIIFVPMFLSNTPPKQDNSTQNLNIPPAPERNFETRNLAVDTPAGALPTPQAPASSASSPNTGASGSTAPKVADSNRLASVDTGAPSTFEAPDNATLPKPGSVTPAATVKPVAPTPVAIPTPPPAPATQADGRFLVNLGVYSDQGHANALVDKVKKLGYPAFAENTEFQGKTAQRVRIGPYADRAAAENVRLKIKQVDAKVPSSIVEAADQTVPTLTPAATPKAAAASTPASPATATAPSANLAANRAGGYAVQLGAFKSEAEANKLRDRLRNGGVASFIDKTGDGDQSLWKVRAGPYADHAGADTALASIKQKFQITGMVKTLP